MKAITVFTPAYNRAHTLPRLYESLCRQTCLDFEWIVVDDGSKDDTSKIMASFIAEHKIDIKYFFQKNAGQAMAMNRGIQEADSLLFFMLDSDDYAPENAIGLILEKWKKVENDPDICGVVGNRCLNDGSVVGTVNPYDEIISDFSSYRSLLGIKGDRAEVVKTSIIKQYLYPQFEGERSIPIALIFIRMAQKYKVLYFNQCIYVADYLPDGIGAYWIKNRINNPRGTALYYSELVKYSQGILYKIRMAINYWRYAPYHRISLSDKVKMVKGGWWCLIPVGYLFYVKDKFGMNVPKKRPGIKEKYR